MEWHAQPDVLTYDRTHVVYLRVAVAQARAYVGVTSKGLWEREQSRVRAAFVTWGGTPHGRGEVRRNLLAHLRSLGPVHASADFFYVPLEHIPPLAGETAPEWVTRVRPQERWWIHQLSCGYNTRRGWNYEHTADGDSAWRRRRSRRPQRLRRSMARLVDGRRRLSAARRAAAAAAAAAAATVTAAATAAEVTPEEVRRPMATAGAGVARSETEAPSGSATELRRSPGVDVASATASGSWDFLGPARPPTDSPPATPPCSPPDGEGEAAAATSSGTTAEAAAAPATAGTGGRGRAARQAKRHRRRRTARQASRWQATADRAALRGAGALRTLVTTTSLLRLRAALPVLRTAATAAAAGTAVAMAPGAAGAAAAAAARARLVFEAVRSRVTASRAALTVRNPRALLITGYVGSVMDRIGLARIVASEEVMSLFPRSAMELTGKPMVVYKYFSSVGELLCNWGKASRQAAREARPCRCAEAARVAFHGAGTAHVVTKDVSVIDDARIRALLKRGVKYRATYAQLFVNEPRMEDDILNMIEAGCDKLAERHEHLHGGDASEFFPWTSTLLAKATEALGSLSPEETDELFASRAAREAWGEDMADAIRRVHSEFVITPADKETSVVTVTCRSLWEQKVRGEVMGCGAYEWQGGGGGYEPPRVPPSAPPAPIVPPPPPPLTPPRRPAGILEVDEATRIMRATHAFGVLGDVLCSIVPDDARVERMFEEASARLQGVEAARLAGRRPDLLAETVRRAEARLVDAFRMVRAGASRRRVHARLWAEARAARRVTTRLSCPVDVAALETYAASELGRQRCGDSSSVWAAGTTYAEIVRVYLARYVAVRDESDPSVGWVTLEYAHGARTAALVAAGWLAGGRESAPGDPFRLPKPLRSVALRRFGFDFDDAACYPRALLAAVAVHRRLPAMLLRSEAAREEIYAGVAAALLPMMSAVEARGRVKLLFNLLDMDGTYSGWRAAHLGDPAAGAAGPRLPQLPMDTAGLGPEIELTDGGRFDVRLYLRQQPERTQWVADQRPHLLALYARWAEAEVPPSERKPPERTLKSDLCAEYEAASRAAKVWWARTRGHAPLSLQHDGVVIALREGVGAEEARGELQVVSSRALGYEQPVSMKPMPTDAPGPAPLVRPWRPRAQPPAAAVALAATGGSELARVLEMHYEWVRQRGMLPGRGSARRAAGEEAARETEKERFMRERRLSYLYATVKTHKTPYGWRFIAGGCEISVGPVSDWVHRACKGLVADVDEMFREAVAGLDGGHRCVGSWILRDGGGVVERVRHWRASCARSGMAAVRATRRGATWSSACMTSPTCTRPCPMPTSDGRCEGWRRRSSSATRASTWR